MGRTGSASTAGATDDGSGTRVRTVTSQAGPAGMRTEPLSVVLVLPDPSVHPGQLRLLAHTVATYGALVVLPDEPYEFTTDDGPEAFTRTPTRLVSGRLLTWYGPALLEARHTLDRVEPAGR